MTLELITTPQQLEQLCAELAGQNWVTLDTEFMRERTYYAQLCLLQLATEDAVYCVDPLALSNMQALLNALQRPTLLKVLHSARQDVEVLYDLTGTPLAPIFDTQIAAALCGEDTHIGYAKLVEARTGVTLPKAHTRADWTRRPLSAAMLKPHHCSRCSPGRQSTDWGKAEASSHRIASFPVGLKTAIRHADRSQ